MPADPGRTLLRFIILLLGWSFLVAIVAAWWWAVAPLNGDCRNSAAGQHIVAEREGIGGECTQAAIDRSKATRAASAAAWSIGTVAIAAGCWAAPRLTSRAPAGYPESGASASTDQLKCGS
ncbi:MAG: hypothetical protein ACRD2W_21440 [Acidimicrobiales bacterium]